MPYSAAADPNLIAKPQINNVRNRRVDRYAKGAPITPSDTVDLTAYAAGVVVTAAGNLKVLPSQNADGAPITFTSAPVGFIPPFQVRRVFATGTTASVASLDV